MSAQQGTVALQRAGPAEFAQTSPQARLSRRDDRFVEFCFEWFERGHADPVRAGEHHRIGFAAVHLLADLQRRLNRQTANLKVIDVAEPEAGHHFETVGFKEGSSDRVDLVIIGSTQRYVFGADFFKGFEQCC